MAKETSGGKKILDFVIKYRTAILLGLLCVALIATTAGIGAAVLGAGAAVGASVTASSAGGGLLVTLGGTMQAAAIVAVTGAAALATGIASGLSILKTQTHKNEQKVLSGLKRGVTKRPNVNNQEDGRGISASTLSSTSKIQEGLSSKNSSHRLAEYTSSVTPLPLKQTSPKPSTDAPAPSNPESPSSSSRRPR